MEIKLLKQLNQTDGLSISQLANLLNLSTIKTLDLISKINQVQPHLISGNATTYRLTSKLNFLNQQEITRRLKENNFEYNCLILDHCDSSNNYAMNHISQLDQRSIISCEWQYAGRGRFGRKWLSTIAHDITVSFVYHFKLEFKVQLLPIVCAVAINRLLKNYQIANKIKWPNDIYHADTKIAGVLVENILRNNINNVVIGIGLDNINNLERNQLLVDLVVNLEQAFSEFKLFGFPLLRREWLDNCWHLNRQVQIQQNGVTIAEGTHCDINENGELIINTPVGKQSFSSSAISLIVN